MKKLIVPILACALLCGCSAGAPFDVGLRDYVVTEPDYTGYVTFAGEEWESDYSNITAEILKETYTPEDDRASCDVTDNNPGKMFYIHQLTYLERLDGDTWVNIPYENKSVYMQEGGWAVCWIEGNYDKPNKTRASVCFDMLSEPMRTGSYRLVVFVGDTKLYAPFEYEE